MSSGDNIAEILRDRYRLLSELGEGGFGKVYQAEQIATGQHVAVKVLSLGDTRAEGDADTRLARFRQEMRLCAQLHHPNIVRLIDAGQAGPDVVYTVFELAPGMDLSRVLAREGRLDPVETKHLMLQLLDALACAHGQSVVHRDLKPANVIVTHTGARRNAIVLDFGIGAVAADAAYGARARLTRTHESICTPSYAAPEQIRGDAPTCLSDLYAWGLLFIECLTGRRVVDGETMLEVARKHLSEEPIPIPEPIASHPLGGLLRRALAKKPTARNVTAKWLMTELDACDLRGLPMGPPTLRPAAYDATTETVERRFLEATAPHDRGEVRQISALCCAFDVSVDGPGACDVEDLDLLLRAEQEACADIGRRFGGAVVGALGDMVMIHFGHVVAREDDAERAARAALAIMAAAQARSEELRARRRVRLNVRAALHTGLILTSDPRERSLLHGDPGRGATPSEAARLCSGAAPGTILISGESRRLLRRAHKIEPAHTADRAPLATAYELREGSPAAGRDDIALIGRAREMDLALDSFRRASRGAGQALLLSGEQGIGKSRVVRELKRMISEAPHTWIECRCAPEGAPAALSVVTDLLAQLVDPEQRAPEKGKIERLKDLLTLHGFDVSEALPVLLPLMNGAPPGTRPTSSTLPWVRPLGVTDPGLGLPVDRRHASIHGLLLSLLFEMAERRPLVLVIEDLQWADPATLELLDALVDEISSERALAVFTARPELAPTWSQAAVRVLSLDRLAAEDVGRMARTFAGDVPLSESRVAHLVARADGVPLFVEEIVHDMFEPASLVGEGDGDDLAEPLSPGSIPITLRPSLAAQLDRLGRAKETAQVASAIGCELTFELLCEVSRLSPAEVQEDLDRLVEAGVLERRRRAKARSYAFRRALMRDAAHESMQRARQNDLRARIAKAIDGDALKAPASPPGSPAAAE